MYNNNNNNNLLRYFPIYTRHYLSKIIKVVVAINTFILNKNCSKWKKLVEVKIYQVDTTRVTLQKLDVRGDNFHNFPKVTNPI